MIQEGKISSRQLRRAIFIETFGTGALSVPALACYKGQSGFWALIFYGIFLAGTTAFFVLFSEKGWKESEILSQKQMILYVIRFFINAAALFYFFGKTIQTVYMPESGLFFILFPAAVLLWYSLHTTLQKRARFVELIFPWIIITVLIAIILSFSGIKRTIPAGKIIWKGIFSDNLFQSMGNGYLLLLCSSPIEFLLFTGSAASAVSEKNSQQQASTEKNRKNTSHLSQVAVAVVGTFLCNAVFIFLAVQTLGQTLTSQSAWPVIKMMQLIRLPGGFLERFDILPAVFWILCMIAVLSGYLYYGKYLLEHFFNNRIFNNRMKAGAKPEKIKSEKTELKNTELKKTESGITESEVTKAEIRNPENFTNKTSFQYSLMAGIVIVCLLLFACLVEKTPVLWTFYLKYKAFVDFPLSLLLPLFVCFRGKKKSGNKNSRKTDKEKKLVIKNRKPITKKTDNKKRKRLVPYFFIFTVISSMIFSLTGCQRLTDVEEKNYILSMYVDYPSEKEDVYEFWIAHADLSKMDERDDEIPCQITEIKAGSLQELEEKYMETVPGKTEWNHIYAIFLGTGMAADKRACTRLLKEWDNAWQKSPNVLLALCPESAETLYTIENIPEGAAGQEASLLAEQNIKQDTEQNGKQNANQNAEQNGKGNANQDTEQSEKQNRKENMNQNAEQKKENFEAIICETPIDYLKAIEQKQEKIPLYRITIKDGRMTAGKGMM